jgi:hypothetical protein
MTADPERRDHEWCVPHDHVQPTPADPERRSVTTNSGEISSGLAVDPADPERRSVTVETLAATMNASFTYADRYNARPDLPFADDIEGFWEPFAAKVFAAIPQDATPAGLDVERLRKAMTTFPVRRTPTVSGNGWIEGPAMPTVEEVAAEYARLAATDPEGIASAGGPVHSEHSE